MGELDIEAQSERDFSWVKTYPAIADALRSRNSKDPDLLALFNEASSSHFDEIDPFSFFASFNRGLTWENRTTIIQNILHTLSISEDAPTCFEGLPVVNNLKSWYRGGVDTDCEYCWALFTLALDYADDKSSVEPADFAEAFDRVMQIKNVGPGKLTTALYWIRPTVYMPLDSNSQTYLAEHFGIKECHNRCTGDEYLAILNAIHSATDAPIYELSADAYDEVALKEVDLSQIPLHANQQTRHYWWLNAKPGYWTFDSLGVGDTEEYTAYNDKGNKRQKYKYFEAAQPGDLVVGYHTFPQMEAVCLCQIEKAMDSEAADVHDRFIAIKKIADAPKFVSHDDLKTDSVLSQMEYVKGNPTGSLFSLTSNEFSRMTELMGLSEYSSVEEGSMPKTNMVDLNTILYGPPGTGKTFMTKAYAVGICDGEDPKAVYKRMEHDGYEEVAARYKQLVDEGRVAFITFHQSYGYEEFIEGIRPVLDRDDEPDESGQIHYDLFDGVFKKFCRRAYGTNEMLASEKVTNVTSAHTAAEPKSFVFIIDEINRGEISKIFGELITLLEDTKRIGAKEERRVRLPYSGDSFGVPSNVYVIGTMNSADRSTALIDTALRRRFVFEEMMPEPETLTDIEIEGINVSEMLSVMNKRIEFLFDRDHTIGHAYFISLKSEPSMSRLAEIFRTRIIPLLQEYFFDDYPKICAILGNAAEYFIERVELSDSLFPNEDDVRPAKDIYCVRAVPTTPEAYQRIYAQDDEE